MKGIKHFIIAVDKAFKDSIEVGEVELFINTKISRDRASNRFGTVVNTPADGEETQLKEGFQVIFDATILYRQLYKEGTQESIHLVDAEKLWYKIEPEMILLFRENEKEEWQGYKDNLMVSFVSEKPKVPSGLLAHTEANVLVKGKATVKYRNAFLKEEGIQNGQEIFINPSSGIPFFFKNETIYWIRSKDVLAA